MRFYRLCSVLAAGMILSSGAVYAQGTIATVNGVKIPESRLKMLSKGKKLAGDQEKKAKEFLIQNEVIAQAAKKKGLQQKQEVISGIDWATQQLLVAAYVENFMKTTTVPEAQLKQEYDRQIGMMGDKEYKARHILVATEAEANALLERLKKGERFAKLAQEKSLDKGSAANGGLLDWVQSNDFDGAIDNVGKGEYTKTPVKSTAGYHLIMVEDIRPFKKPTYNESKDQLAQIVKNKMFSEHVEQMVKQAKIQ